MARIDRRKLQRQRARFLRDARALATRTDELIGMAFQRWLIEAYESNDVEALGEKHVTTALELARRLWNAVLAEKRGQAAKYPDPRTQVSHPKILASLNRMAEQLEPHWQDHPWKIETLTLTQGKSGSPKVVVVTELRTWLPQLAKQFLEAQQGSDLPSPGDLLASALEQARNSA